MRHLVAANDQFAVYSPSLISWAVVSALIQLKPSQGFNWWVRHEPSGTKFRLTAEEQRVLDQLGDRLGKLLNSLGRDASDALLNQIQLFWRQRERKQQVNY